MEGGGGGGASAVESLDLRLVLFNEEEKDDRVGGLKSPVESFALMSTVKPLSAMQGRR